MLLSTPILAFLATASAASVPINPRTDQTTNLDQSVHTDGLGIIRKSESREDKAGAIDQVVQEDGYGIIRRIGLRDGETASVDDSACEDSIEVRRGAFEARQNHGMCGESLATSGA